MTSDKPDPGPVLAHWERVWGSTTPEEVSWFQALPRTSLELIRATGLGSDCRIIDVGGGASRLVDVLLEHGYSNVSVLDVAETALSAARKRLGDRAEEVEWLVGDVRSFEPPHAFDLWHDRALFHFLVEASDRIGYRSTLRRAVVPGGQAVLASFGPEGPERCSGLPVIRYDAASLSAELGDAFDLVEARVEIHRTPSGSEQQFLYCLLRRTSAAR